MDTKIDKVDIILMTLVAIFFDLVSLIPLINWIIYIPAWFTFFIWFRIKGISFTSNWKKITTVFGVSIIEIVPVISIIPSWIVLVWATIFFDKLEEKIKLPVTYDKKPKNDELSKFRDRKNTERNSSADETRLAA